MGLDDFLKFRRVVDLRHDVDFELVSRPAQNSVALREFAVVIVVVSSLALAGIFHAACPH